MATLSGLNIYGTTNIAVGSDLFNKSLERLIFTGNGGYLGIPYVFSRVPEFLNEPATEETVVKIAKEIRSLITKYFPIIKLKSIYVEFVNLKNGNEGIIFEIDGQAVSDQELSFTSKFYKARIVN